MSQRHRFDVAGECYHVMNRGIAKRTIAENVGDAEAFFEELSRVVADGILTVESGVLMTTHFHLLVRSTRGDFWRGMRRFQNGYSRRFNRSRRRDGPLFRGRYRSRWVRTHAYWVNVVRYIDHNPVSARLVECPQDWPFGSARLFATGETAPWLDRSAVEGFVSDWTLRSFSPAAYEGMFGASDSGSLVEARLHRPERGDPSLVRLLPPAPSRARDWMAWKAELADGTTAGDPVCTATALDAVLDECRERGADARVRRPRGRVPPWGIMRVALLRIACGLSLAEVAARSGVSAATVHARVRSHVELVRTDDEYASLAATVLSQALERVWSGPGARPVHAPEQVG